MEKKSRKNAIEVPEGVSEVLLHACCAPCSSAIVEWMLANGIRPTIYYYNPNIFPNEEYDRRVSELQRLSSVLPVRQPFSVTAGPYEPERFEDLARGLEEVPEGGERCFRCYRLRLSQTAEKAAREGYDYFTTTLSVSPYKNAGKLNQIGAELAEVCGVPYLFSDFKKNDGYLRSIRNSRAYDLYRQDYCGCVYSKEQREKARQF